MAEPIIRIVFLLSEKKRMTIKVVLKVLGGMTEPDTVVTGSLTQDRYKELVGLNFASFAGEHEGVNESECVQISLFSLNPKASADYAIDVMHRRGWASAKLYDGDGKKDYLPDPMVTVDVGDVRFEVVFHPFPTPSAAQPPAGE